MKMYKIIPAQTIEGVRVITFVVLLPAFTRNGDGHYFDLQTIQKEEFGYCLNADPTLLF
jgi:hypothetical protein